VECNDPTGFALDEYQKQAVELCCTFDHYHRIIAVSGRAGTGKTSIMRLVYEAAKSAGHNPVLCAPTGKAARRISEATGIPALTVHKLLEFPRPGEIDERTGKPLVVGAPKRNQDRPLSYNIVLVDEAAMLSASLYTQLIFAIPKGGYLRMFGDQHQLPPIEVSPALVNQPSKFVHWVNREVQGVKSGIELQIIHRQGEGSGIVENGSLILQGRMPRHLPDFSMRATGTQLSVLCDIVKEDLNEFDALSNQIIIPGNRGPLGVFAVNTVLQRLIRPEGERHPLPRYPYDKHAVALQVDDKVIMTKNNYEIGQEGIMNGEVGRVVEFDEKDKSIIIKFGDEYVYVPPVIHTRYKRSPDYPLCDVALAYALTTHKTQGSEYDRVIFVMDNAHRFILYRNNFYTGVTRAKKKADVIYAPSVMSRALCAVPMIAGKKV
jgi:exodeoxyribonuclease V alpha subunit